MQESSVASSTVPFLSLLMGGGRGGSGTTTTADGFGRTLSTTATVGLSFFILRFVATAARVAGEIENEENNTNFRYNSNNSNAARIDATIQQFVKNVLRRLMMSPVYFRTGTIITTSNDDDDGETSEEENVPMIHQGCCHCGAVRFELIAPTRIICKESQNGKIQFRHARIRAKSFRFVSGAHLVKMYYVNKSSSSSSSSSSNNNIGAHSFCSRCGVHLLHAPNSRSTALDVNVDCLNADSDVKVKSATGKGKGKVDLSVGFPVADQWDNESELSNSHRYIPATIAEEHHQHSGLQRPFDTSSPFAAYKNHPVMRQDHDQEWDPLMDYADYNTAPDDSSTIDLVFPNGAKAIPGTPSTTHTVYTTQTEPLSSTGGGGGVPPTLTLDTRVAYTDSESVVSLSSTRSGYPPLPQPSSTTSSSYLRVNNHNSLLLQQQDSFGALPSPPANGTSGTTSNSGISPSTTPLVRHQMNYYMRKHMSSSSSVSSSSSRISPSAAASNGAAAGTTKNSGMPPLFPTPSSSNRDVNQTRTTPETTSPTM